MSRNTHTPLKLIVTVHKFSRTPTDQNPADQNEEIEEEIEFNAKTLVAFGRKKYFNDSSLAEQIAFTDEEGTDIPLLSEWEAEELEFYTMKGIVCLKIVLGIYFFLRCTFQTLRK